MESCILRMELYPIVIYRSASKNSTTGIIRSKFVESIYCQSIFIINLNCSCIITITRFISLIITKFWIESI